MYQKTDEVKVLRDPIHGYIHVELQAVWDIINSRWFQRLRRIRQLGGANMVYHCAEHTRFAHSLGVYEIVRRMVTEIPDIASALNEKEKLTVMLAGLLHDIGHGPYSHAFEAVTVTSHETYTCRIIEDGTEITKILENTEKGLSHDVADVIRHRSANPILSQMISSQLDADRMDYLLRDAYFTGTTYGEFDLERIFRTLRIHDGRQLAIKESGVYAVENYIMSRYHMYWQVYYHPTARSYERLLYVLFQRLKDLKDDSDPSLIPLLKPVVMSEDIPLDQYFALDEYTCGYGFEQLCSHSDAVVRDIALRIRDRKLFVFADSTPALVRKIRSSLKKSGYDPKYYLIRDIVTQKPYVPYTGDADGSIWVQMKDGITKELSGASNIVYSLIHGPAHDDNKIFYPSETQQQRD